MKSLASQKSDYVAVQIRTRDSYLHVQGRGVKGNREYGFAQDFPHSEPNHLKVWLKGQKHVLPSMAGTSALYVPAQVSVRKGFPHVQVAGGKKNRDYGACFELRKGHEEFVLWIEAQQKQNDLDALSKGEPAIVMV